MRIFNVDKTRELNNYEIDTKKGCLRADKMFVRHHEAVEGKPAVYGDRIEVLPNGSKQNWKDLLISPAVEGKEAYDEYEDIQIYIPLNDEQIESQYESKVESLIRERYSVSQELAILRQQESKTEEYQAYYDYCEECKIKARAEVYGNEV